VIFPIRQPLIYLISDGSITNGNYEKRSADLLELIDAAVRFRIPLVQIREKDLSGRHLFDLASVAVRKTGGSATRLLINDRLDVALASGADGVQLTSNSFSPDAVRQVAPDGFVVGVSTHSTDEIQRAKATRADFAVYGPIYETPGKGSATGLNKLGEIVRTTDQFPVLALGGVDYTNYRDVLNTGAAGLAAIRFLNDAANLEMLSKEFGL
jgi:thiamine-phosphate pyrophosphorylase